MLLTQSQLLTQQTKKHQFSRGGPRELGERLHVHFVQGLVHGIHGLHLPLEHRTYFIEVDKITVDLGYSLSQPAFLVTKLLQELAAFLVIKLNPVTKP